MKNWKEKKKIQSALMEEGGGRDYIPMSLFLHGSKGRERYVPFIFAQTVPHVSIPQVQPNNQPPESIQTTEQLRHGNTFVQNWTWPRSQVHVPKSKDEETKS